MLSTNEYVPELAVEKSFEKLIKNVYNYVRGNQFSGFPLSFYYAGQYYDYWNERGLVGRYWSRQAANGATGFYLLFGSDGGLFLRHSDPKNHGFSVRCVELFYKRFHMSQRMDAEYE